MQRERQRERESLSPEQLETLDVGAASAANSSQPLCPRNGYVSKFGTPGLLACFLITDTPGTQAVLAGRQRLVAEIRRSTAAEDPRIEVLGRRAEVQWTFLPLN